MEALFFIGITIFSRFIPHIPNVTSVGAVALFVGGRYSFKKSLIILLTAMLVSDAVLGFHPVMWATYASLCITLMFGLALKKKSNWKRIGIITFFSSFQFFVLTNFAVWLTGLMYPKTLEGLIQCYIMALPFFRNSLVGDYIYTTVLFGLYFYVQQTKRIVPTKEVRV
jgi:hypothetical protein